MRPNLATLEDFFVSLLIDTHVKALPIDLHVLALSISLWSHALADFFQTWYKDIDLCHTYARRFLSRCDQIWPC